MAKTNDHNGKEIKQSNGKNIRVSEYGWNKIRKFCFQKGFKMGKFTEESALEAIRIGKKVLKENSQTQS